MDGDIQLVLKNINTFYGNIQILRDVSMEVKKGEIVALLGANGSGKSTTINTISGFMSKIEGGIYFENRKINGLPPEKIVRMGIVQVPQAKEIFPDLTVTENLKMGAYIRNDKKGIKEDIRKIYNYFPQLEKFKNAMAGAMSGGVQQMLSIGRGLMARPKILLLDEPSCRLAPLVVKEIFRIIKKINDEGTTILLVEQNIRMAMSVSHFTYIIQNGVIVIEGETAELGKDDEIKRTYLGW